MQCNAMQCSPVQRSALHCNATQCIAMHCNVMHRPLEPTVRTPCQWPGGFRFPLSTAPPSTLAGARDR
eukprot:3465493-Lingulodinium_polyedra.AAC.1